MDDTITRHDLDLAPLDIREVRERLEISPLLAGGNDAIGGDTTCCTCKIRPADPDNPGGLGD